MAGPGGIPDWVISLVILMIVIMAVVKLLGIDASFVQAFRATRRVRVMDEPRDQLERLVNNHRKVAKDTKPPQLKNLVLAGDRDIPMYDYGKIRGIETHDQGYIVYVVTSRLGWSKPHIIIRELAGDVNRRNLFVHARGFTTDGAFRWAIPNSMVDIDPTTAFLKSKEMFDMIFGVQNYVDSQEDSAWAQASAIMPSVSSRVAMANVEVPGRMVETPYYSENEVLK